jgi:transcriptional antiterminator NusG
MHANSFSNQNYLLHINELKFWLKGLNGASGFLTNRSGEILPLSETEVNRMIGQQEEQKIEVETPFVIGEEVKIIDGPFSTMLGKIDDINDQKVKLNVSIFGRVTVVELNIIQIDKK